MPAALRVAFVAVVSAMCFSALLGFALAKAAPGVFPADVNLAGGSATKVTLEQIKRNPVAALLDGRLKEKVESEAEERLGASVPFHDGLLLASAGLQRLGIATANLVAGYDVTPTFYGSDFFVRPADERIGFISYAADDAVSEYYERWTDAVNRLAADNPGLRIAYDQVYTSRQGEYNPTYGLVSNPLTHERMVEMCLARLDSRIIARDDYFADEQDYLQNWFSTDHHWTCERALASYDALAGELGWERYSFDDPVVVSPTWYGSFCRTGLCLDYTSDLLDSPAAFPQIEWTYQKGAAGERDAFLAGEASYEGNVFNLYDAYYGSVDCEALNRAEGAAGTCLVFCNSMTRPLKGYIASNYRRCVFIDPDNGTVDKPIQQVIDEVAPDDVVFIMTPGFRGANENNPDFLGAARG